MKTLPKIVLSLAISVLALPWAAVIAASIHDAFRPAEDTQIIWVCELDGDRNCGDQPTDISIHLPWREW